MDVDKSDAEDMDAKNDKSVKPGGRGHGGRGRDGGGRGDFKNFVYWKDPPHVGEKEVPLEVPLDFLAAFYLSYLVCIFIVQLSSLESEEAEDLIKHHGGGHITGSILVDGSFTMDMIQGSNKLVERVSPSPPKKSPQNPGKKQAFQTDTNLGTKGLTSISASSDRKNQLDSWTDKYRPKSWKS
ncbi:replication factor C subunit 1 [Salvia divinorum]|uniref:Replication factor C subunit 1 n=1 Tax=Salvia divinorum TaxID=28513 RepID=A0ABD1GNB9_SALDI